MSNCNYYRNLWWDKGEFDEKAKWEEVALPYVLATDFTIEEYEQLCIGEIVNIINKSCGNVDETNAKIFSIETRGITRGKVADASFRPKKQAITSPNGSDENNFPWPNLVVEVAYTETLDHVEESLHYWLSPGRAHDCIIVKIDPVPQGQVPVRMRAWHYCVSAGRGTRNTVPLVTLVTTVMFEFGTKDGTGSPLNILQGQCIVNISLNCLYNNVKPPIKIPEISHMILFQLTSFLFKMHSPKYDIY
ncbi:12718_t:CDS:2 [Acaulospora morrowiae]|uniref:12718_t:CDS:1 n=1 Tax=Acaulospora morrowiae TaxID=94023 RepID=A0A9N8V773_9GLOM|nr:12718_t:CDS:2 [Acaulospora morrowiae]